MIEYKNKFEALKKFQNINNNNSKFKQELSPNVIHFKTENLTPKNLIINNDNSDIEKLKIEKINFDLQNQLKNLMEEKNHIEENYLQAMKIIELNQKKFEEFNQEVKLKIILFCIINYI